MTPSSVWAFYYLNQKKDEQCEKILSLLEPTNDSASEDFIHLVEWRPSMRNMILKDLHFSVEEVKEDLDALNANKTSGPDGVENRLLKESICCILFYSLFMLYCVS